MGGAEKPTRPGRAGPERRGSLSTEPFDVSYSNALAHVASGFATMAGVDRSTPGLSAVDLDKLAVEVLKDVHNRGADHYNSGFVDAALGTLRMYQGALRTVRAFLPHHPTVQRLIDVGLAEVDQTDGSKLQAFRLHEVIEQVRAELKAAIRQTDEAAKAGSAA